MTKAKKAEMEEARGELRKLLRPGNTIITTLRHVSRSGMLRIIDLHLLKRGKLVWIAGYAARATDMPMDRKQQGIRIGGCGMDMGFALVYSLSFALYYSKRKNAPSAGYRLKQRWL